jgi:uncharacterized membrane protein
LRERCGADLWKFQALFLFLISVSVWVLSCFLSRLLMSTVSIVIINIFVQLALVAVCLVVQIHP